MAGLRVAGITVSYDGYPALRDTSLEAGPGELVGVIGPNGAGKSTLLKALAGLVPVETGAVHIPGSARGRRRGRHLAYVAQRASVDWDYPAQVRDVVAMGRYPHRGSWRRPGPVDRAVVDEALERLDLAPLARRRIGDLSGGQAQRVFLARALAQEATLLLLDEPYAGVDATSAALLDRELRQLAAGGATVVVVSHDLAAGQERFSRLVLLMGTVIADGPPPEVLASTHLAAAYDGRTNVRGAC